MDIKRLIVITVIALFILGSFGCSSNKMHKEGLISVTVIDKSALDGCGFVLFTSDHQTLIPVNLKKEFCVEGLKLTIAFKKVNVMTTCMAGETISLTYCEKK
jgi:hypothetical protein